MKKNLFLMLAAILCCSLWMTSCSNQDDPVTPTDEVEAQLAKMTLREKVGQMFYVRMETLDTTIHRNTYAELQENPVLEVNQTMRDVNERYPVGGLILYAWNIDTESQLATLISQIRSLNGQPLLCIDEEGGRVARIANNPNFNVKKYESMIAIGDMGDPANAYECGNTIGTYLHRYGFDIDFAPVADVNTNPENVIIGARAFSDDPAVAAPMVTNYLQGLKDAGDRVYQAFPWSWRYESRYPFRLRIDPEDVGRDDGLRDGHLQGRHPMGLPADHDGTYRYTESHRL